MAASTHDYLLDTPDYPRLPEEARRLTCHSRIGPRGLEYEVAAKIRGGKAGATGVFLDQAQKYPWSSPLESGGELRANR